MGSFDDPFGLNKIGRKTQKPKSKSNTISKTEWETIKSVHGKKCVLCGKSEKAVGKLEKAHIKAASKGGSQVLPMCPTCHTKFDTGKLTDAKLKKLGLTRTNYNRIRPKSGKVKTKSTSSKTQSPFDIPSFSPPKFDLPSFDSPFDSAPKKKGRKKKKDDEPWRLL
ncbi:MAG: hypothetical protein SYNGOMJ08_00712 [Candidatus Syntrophoarchaeum sp. GoM_oil]|nr:MAG: hypothetical protein SYNGOMJ08_00712 [Candidatus Syntrophoarchaeum sp. GoM_oil]